MTFVLYMPMVVSFCEEPRNIGIMGSSAAANDGVRPMDFGVRFDETRGMCKMTHRYCTRFGLEYDPNANFGAGECKSNPGMEVAEAIFGTTLVRGNLEPDQDDRRRCRPRSPVPKRNQVSLLWRTWRTAGLLRRDALRRLQERIPRRQHRRWVHVQV